MTTNDKPVEGHQSPDDLLLDKSEWSFDTQDLRTREYDATLDRSGGMTDGQFKKATAICAILFLVLSGTGLILERAYPQDPKLEFSDCALIDNAAERLTCYDKVAHDNATEPAKGATPPALW
jgi:hypothetical protein